MKRIAFFFGSGISRASGAPTVDQLTNSILGDPWEFTSRETFVPKVPGVSSHPFDDGNRFQEFLRLLADEIGPEIKRALNRMVNYEDLYAAAIQIVDYELKVLVNPMILRSYAALRSQSSSLYLGKGSHVNQDEFASLADRACTLIQWAVFHGLLKATAPVGMGALADVCQMDLEVDIFTLNHDTLIERLLKGVNITFADGFSECDGDVTYFNSNWPSSNCRLFKLHGSVDWYRFQSGGKDRYARVSRHDSILRDRSGDLLDGVDSTPVFLTGTYVKEKNYGVNFFGEHFSEFRQRLCTHEKLVCCGYGWGDSGINIRLSQWLREDDRRQITVLHGGPCAHLELWRSRLWTGYVKQNRVTIVPKWLSECTVDDLISTAVV
ncbi:MAG TPA: SIR2 family protein [Opitutaceae bacterium]|nr:SIR2 family protein [Opitutaceae bacterium]